MSIRNGMLLLALGVLTFMVGSVAAVNISKESIASGKAHRRPSDEALKRHLQDALNEHWDLHRAHIVVESVENGVVTLSGQAEELSYHVRAVELVANSPGVQGVKSRFQTPGQLSGIAIRNDAREPTANPARSSWEAWMVVPIGNEDAQR